MHGVDQLVVGLGEDLPHLGERPRGADACDDVLALRVDEELAVEGLLAGRRVAGEADAGGGGVAAVAEDHLHDVDGGAEAGGDVVGAAVDLGARVLPRLEHGIDGAVQLLTRIAGPLATQLLIGDLLERGDELLEVLGRQVRVVLDAAAALQRGQGVLVHVRRHALHDLAVHLDEAAVAVPREALVARLLRHRDDRLVGDAEVQDRVHHAGHGEHGAGADGDEQRLRGAAERAAGALLQAGEALRDLLGERLGPGATVVHRLNAGLRGDGERVGDRDPDLVHLCHAGSLAAEQGLHARVAFAEVVDVADVIHAGKSPSTAQGLRRPLS